MRKATKTIVILTTMVILLEFASAVLAANGVFDMPVYQATGGGNVSSDGHITIAGVAGQHEAGSLSSGSVAVYGGVIPELLTGFRSGPGTLYLPNVVKTVHFCTAKPVEQEPNDTLTAANDICRDEPIQGSHDGNAGTGDVFRAWLTGGSYIQLDLETTDPNGVQLLLYKLEDGETILLSQDAEAPFQIIAFIDSPGEYYIYVYSDPEVNNTADYSLLFDTSSGLAGQDMVVLYHPNITPASIIR